MKQENASQNSTSVIPQSAIRNPQSEDFSRYDQKLEFILRNAARIFAEKGYHSTSMRDISRETGVSLAGLYYYCRSKEELLFLIQDNCFGHVLERLEQRLREASGGIEKLRLVLENHLIFARHVGDKGSRMKPTRRGRMREPVRQEQQYTRLCAGFCRRATEKEDARAAVDPPVATSRALGYELV